MCQGTIYYCWGINPQGLLIEIIDRIEMDITCSPRIIFDNAFYDYVSSIMLNDVVNLGSQLPNCNGTQVFLVQSTSCQCYKIENDPDHFVMRSIPCFVLGNCQTTYRVCWNPTTLSVEKTLMSRNGQGGECPSGYPIMPPQGESWSTHWITDCYLGSFCNTYP